MVYVKLNQQDSLCFQSQMSIQITKMHRHI